MAYVFVFAFLLWLVLWPLKPANWQYRNVLIFVALTAPPAFLYVLPGRFLPADAIPQAKVLLLAFVAVWRVALLGRYLWGPAGLRGGRLFVAICFPLALLVTALVVLNLDHVIFDLMGGGLKSPNDEAYSILLLIDFVALIAMPGVLQNVRLALRTGPPNKCRHWTKLGLIAMSGIRVQDAELMRLGLTLPGVVERSQVIASLPSLGLLTLAGSHSACHRYVLCRTPPTGRGRYSAC